MQNIKANQNDGYQIIVDNLYKNFKNVKVLKGVSFKVAKGSIFALLGPNGAGKTTIIKILSTLLTPDSGQAKISDYDVVKQSQNVRRAIGLTGQYAAVDELLSGIENLEMMGRLYHMSKAQAKLRSAMLLKQFDLENAANRPVRTYSGGMKRRLDLAMSLIASPPVIFLDEPTTGLDPRSRISMWNTIKELSKSGITILLTTQYMDEAENLADRLAVLDKGTIIVEGTINELKAIVGSTRLVITFDKTEYFEKASGILHNDIIESEPVRNIITLNAVSGVEKMKEILNCLEENKITVSSICLQRPTLDDVFLELTGQKTDDAENKE